MDVGASIMKKIIVLTVFLFSCSSFAHKDSLTIFDNILRLDDGCQVNITTPQKQYNYSPKFNSAGECTIINHSSTDIPHLKYINGMYILFIENNITTESSCMSEYTAIGISKTNELFVTDLIKRSGSCYQDKELSAFEYFSAKLKKH